MVEERRRGLLGITYMRRPQGDKRRDEARAVVGAAVVGRRAEIEAGDPAAGGVRHLSFGLCFSGGLGDEMMVDGRELGSRHISSVHSHR